MSTQDYATFVARNWIDWARPTDQDADDFYQVEIRLTSSSDQNARSVFAFWGNVGLGTPWRRTWRWRSSKALDHELKQLAQQVQADARCASEERAKEPVVRTYVSITRTPAPSGGWILDAIADDGTAWSRGPISHDWLPISPLPQPDQPDD